MVAAALLKAVIISSRVIVLAKTVPILYNIEFLNIVYVQEFPILERSLMNNNTILVIII